MNEGGAMKLRKVISIFIIIVASSAGVSILPQLQGQDIHKTPYWGHWNTGKKKTKNAKGTAARTGKPATNAAKTATGKAESQRPPK
jgi:hypothetical protein